MDPSEVITAEELKGLPDPVQRCLQYCGVVGSPRIKHVTLKQVGLFKTAPDRPWVPFKAEQNFNLETVSFEWKVRMRMAPGIIVTGRDRLEAGQGSMKIKLFGLFPLVNATGPEIDQGAMTRYLSETVWFPQAFLSPQISWEAIDSVSAKATLTLGEKAVSGVFTFDEQGQVKDFHCQRYATEGKQMLLRPWHTPTDEYGERAGLRIGIRGRAIWERPEGEYRYVDLEIMEIQYE